MVNPSLDEEIKNEQEVSESVCKVRLLITGNGICGFGKTEKSISVYFYAMEGAENKETAPTTEKRKENVIPKGLPKSGRLWKDENVKKYFSSFALEC